MANLQRGFWGDVRFGARMLAKAPGFTLAAIVALAVGIGANTALFSAVHALLWRTPYMHDADRAAAIFTSNYSSTRFGASSFPDFDVLGRGSRTIGAVGAFIDSDARAQFGDEFETLDLSLVSASYFTTLGVPPLAGHVFDNDSEASAVIGEALWERRYGRNPGALGQAISLNGQTLTITGIMPRRFTGTHLQSRPDVWAPVRRATDLIGMSASTFQDKRTRGLNLVARLRDGAALAELQAELDVTAGQLAAADPAAWTDLRGQQRRITALPIRESGFAPDYREPAGQIAMFGFAVIGSLLVIVCATVATMLLARAQARRKEIAIRLSLGAERHRIMRQLLIETGLLSIAGADGVCC